MTMPMRAAAAEIWLGQRYVNQQQVVTQVKWLCGVFQTHIGIKGIVRNTAGEPIESAEIKVADLSSGEPVDIDHDILSRE